jgi:hypothetical protein
VIFSVISPRARSAASRQAEVIARAVLAPWASAVSAWVVRPIMAHRFPYEPARYDEVPDALPGLWPDEPGELMVPAI